MNTEPTTDVSAEAVRTDAAATDAATTDAATADAATADAAATGAAATGAPVPAEGDDSRVAETPGPATAVGDRSSDVDAGRPEPFSILFVCTGNLCRSPMAERIARSALARQFGADADRFVVTSAGTGTYSGRRMTPEAAKVVAEHGGEADGFVSTELGPEAVTAADLVLTATRGHRSQVVTMEPTALRRCFTIVEFARVAAAVTAGAQHSDDAAPSDRPADAGELPTDLVDRARAVVAAASRYRGTVRADRPDDDDIADPIGRPIAVYEDAGARIVGGIDALITALAGERS
jgi:protein-tyrosine phosphatase